MPITDGCAFDLDMSTLTFLTNKFVISRMNNANLN